MNIYIVLSNYFDSGFFGTYSSIKRAQIAFEDFLANDEDIISFETEDSNYYQFTTKIGKTFYAEICWDCVDAEFVEGVCKED